MTADGPGAALLAGVLATTVLTTMQRASVEFRLSRMDLPFLLGTCLTADRDLAKLLGMAAHLAAGLAFSLAYGAFFHGVSAASAVKGAALGLAQGVFVIVIVMPLLPSVHPRMASVTRGPAPTPMLEPPGFLALNYGRGTPAVALLSHVAFGAILGALL